MISLIKNLFPFSFKRSVKEQLGVPSLHWSLQNLKKKGFNPTHVADVGAYEGNWTKDFLEVFPNALVLMIEAQKSKLNILNEVQKNNAGVKYSINLLSSENNKEVEFLENETASHINMNSFKNNDTAVITKNIVRTKTLDSVLEENSFEYPAFLKLDVQGHELEVLKGGLKTLNAVQICLLEVSLLNLGDNAPLFFEIQQFMDVQGFQMYDICQFMRRPYDKALFQMDVLFIKKNSSFVNDGNW